MRNDSRHGQMHLATDRHGSRRRLWEFMSTDCPQISPPESGLVMPTPRPLKNLFDRRAASELQQRIERMQTTTPPLWGTMQPAQALAHCAASLELALGDRASPRLIIGRILGWVVKPLVLGNDRPMRRQTPTIPGLVIQDARDLPREQQRLCRLIDRFVEAGPAGITRHPHSFFGTLRPAQWAVLAYKHLDHHIRQFGA
jgi:hypothetical protein